MLFGWGAKVEGVAPKPAPLVRARAEPTWCARVVKRTPLRYAAGADAAADRPAHVRAGSGATFIDVPGAGRRLAVVQDDARFVALIDVEPMSVGHLTLPRAIDGMRLHDSGRGNKMQKLDLESVCTVVQGGAPVLLALGSGSAAARRQMLSVRFEGRGTIALHDVGALFDALKTVEGIAGGELNIEGMCVRGERVFLFQRGNGRGAAVDLIASVALAPMLACADGNALAAAALDVRHELSVDLGSLGGARLTLTDAAVRKDGSFVFLAAAEASPNAIDDGAIMGTAMGVWDEGGVRTGRLLDEQGQPLCDKVEGIALADDERRAFVVVDKDDPRLPSDLLELTLEGF